MVPGQHRHARICENLANRGYKRIKRQLGSESKIQHPFPRIARRRVRADQRPTAVEHPTPEVFRHIQSSKTGGAQSRHQQDKLQVRHAGTLDIQGLHNDNINRACLGSQFPDRALMNLPTECRPAERIYVTWLRLR